MAMWRTRPLAGTTSEAITVTSTVMLVPITEVLTSRSKGAGMGSSLPTAALMTATLLVPASLPSHSFVGTALTP
jgi:hypothetical protein